MGRRIGVKESRFGVQGGSANGRLERCGGCSLSRQQAADPEPFTLNLETGAKGEVSKNQGTGYGVQDTGCGGYFCSSAAARVWCVYINSKRSKKTTPAAPALAGQQSFPTPTTTDYLHQSLQPQQAEAAINFFLRHTFIYCTHMRKNRTPPVACLGKLERFSLNPEQALSQPMNTR